jgi:hypothetical protein
MVAGLARIPGAADRPPVAGTAPLPTAGWRARTLGHASLALYREGEPPLLLTDPWLVGSVYWRSWWLQHYPSPAEIEWLSASAFVYVTHEHPDHFHMPSIRRLGRGPSYLFPALSERGFLDHIRERGFGAECLAPRRWRRLAKGVAVMSLPLWNDDSLLLIDAPGALILNFNDAKPPPPVLRAVRRLADRVKKPRVLLCSYSPASLVNSFSDERGTVSLRTPRHYVDWVCRLADRLAADFYMPFASQAVFDRADSRWANEHRTLYRDLCRHWRGRTQLLPPYATLDLDGFGWSAPAPENYRLMPSKRVATLTERRLVAEEGVEISAADIRGLERKLNKFRLLLRFVFRRGFAFRLGGRVYGYDPAAGQLAEGAALGDFVVDVPKLTLREAVANNHLSDLGITMLVRIRLLRRLDPRKVYALFVLFQFDDYGHLRNTRSFLRWVGRGARSSLTLRLPLP